MPFDRQTRTMLRRIASLSGVIAALVLATGAAADDIRAPSLSDLNPLDATTRIQSGRDDTTDALFRPSWSSAVDGRWDAFNDGLQKIGLTLGFSYSSLYQHASPTAAHTEGWAGDLDILGRFNLGDTTQDWPKALVFNIENRHKLGRHTPESLSDSIGSLMSTSVYFGEQRTSVSELYLEVGSDENNFTMRLGKQDPSSTYNVFSHADPDNGFLGGGVTNSAISYPDRGWGATARFRPNDLIYITGGFADANADVTKLDFESLKMGEFFYALEAGVTPGYGVDGAAKGLFSVTAWYRDRLSASATPAAYGFALTAEQEMPFNHRLVPFFRYSWNNGSGLVKDQTAVGLVVEEVFGQNQDVVGVALAHASPTSAAFRDEYSVEAFYRVYVTPKVAVSFDLQYIKNPGRTSAYDDVVVAGIRTRIAF